PLQQRALFACVPYIGHALPLLDEALELHARGWNITFVSTTALHRLAAQYETAGLHFLLLDEPPGLRQQEEGVFSAAYEETLFELGSLSIMRHTYQTHWPL